MNIYTSFETERLLLRATSEDDASFLLQLLNSPKWIQNIGDRNVHTIEDAEKYIQERMRPQLERLGYSNYTVIRKNDQVKMGTCGLYDREGLDGVDIGFAFLPAYEGQGYAFEASIKIMDFATRVLNLPLIQGITIEENLPSRKLLEKLDFKLDGTVKLPNDPVELLLYKFHNFSKK